jgi:hypothetical protein
VCRINRFDKTNLVQKVRTANASTKRFRELACSWDTFGAHLAFVSDDGVFVSGCGSDQPRDLPDGIAPAAVELGKEALPTLSR